MKMSTAGGTPTVIADNQGGPIQIVTDQTCVYWTNNKSGAVMKAAK